MRDIVLDASGSLDELPVTPFRFDPECHTLPTSFEVICVADGVRYQYGFSATPHEVTDECSMRAERTDAGLVREKP